jgi:serine/threonine protein phosphatase PrpC
MRQVDWGSATDRGHVRTVNEDALLTAPPVFLVADGMGGYAAGATASAIVVQEFAAPADTSSVTAEWVMDSFRRSQDRIRGAAAGGTTVAGFAAVEQNGLPYWLIFNIGDSRVYRCSAGTVSQISVDHSVVQELIELGDVSREKARFHPQRHIITRAVGSPDGPRPDFWLLPATGGDRLMICSDGVTSELDADQIAELTSAVDTSPQQVAQSLVASALGAGGRDNVTVVVVDVVAVDADVSAGESPVVRRPAIPDDRTLPRLPEIALVGGGDAP